MTRSYLRCLPHGDTGIKLHPTECMQVWEAVARIDTSAAWNLVMNQGIANYAAWLPEAGVAELFSNGIPTIAGAFNPPVHAQRVEGGWQITGQVPFGSGCHRAQWLAMPALEEGADAPFAVFFPENPAQYWIHGTLWGCVAPGPRIIEQTIYLFQPY